MKAGIAISTAGHDLNEIYVAFSVEKDIVLLANGKGKTISKPKRKNPKHISLIECKDARLEELLEKCCTDEAIYQAVLYYKKKLLLTKIE